MACDLERDPAKYLDVLRTAFDKHYREHSDVWTRDPGMAAFPPVIQGYLKLPRTARVLDVGCGVGRDVEYFARVCDDVVGIDLYEHADWAAIAERTSHARFQCVDFLGFADPDPFDAIVDNGCFHHQHPQQYESYLRHAGRLIGERGHFVLSTFKNPGLSERVDANGRLHRYFSDEELHEELRRSGLVPVHELDLWRHADRDYYRLTFCRSA